MLNVSGSLICLTCGPMHLIFFYQEEGGEAEAVTQLTLQGAVLGVVVLAGVVTWIVATTTEGEAMAFISVVHDKTGFGSSESTQNISKEKFLKVRMPGPMFSARCFMKLYLYFFECHFT